MTRSYQHVNMYEKEILKLKEKGLTNSEVTEELGLNHEQIRNFFKRRNRTHQMIEAGKAIQKR